jgi:hypothetical protein
MTAEFSGAPPADALPLLEAIRHFLPKEMWESYWAALNTPRKRSSEPSYFDMPLRDWELAMSRYRAVKAAAPRPPDPAQLMFNLLAALKELLASGELEVYAQDDPPFGPWRKIPMAVCGQLKITNVNTGEGKISETNVSGIHVRKPNLGSYVPTGAPGRPSNMHYVLNEFRRRAKANELEQSVRQEASVLAAWFKKTHPSLSELTAKTIENRIRSEFKKEVPPTNRAPKN